MLLLLLLLRSAVFVLLLWKQSLRYGNSVLVTACHTGTRPPPTDIAINGRGRSRTGVVVWIADSDPPINPCGAEIPGYTY